MNDFDSKNNSETTESRTKVKVARKADFRQDLMEGRPVAKNMQIKKKRRRLYNSKVRQS